MHHQEHLKLTDDQVTACIWQAYKKYTSLKNDKGCRDCWLTDLIEAQAQDTNKLKKSTWKQIRTTKRVQNNAHQIAAAMGNGGERKGLNHVWGPNINNEPSCHESQTKAELECMCLAEARRRFTQASHTPFLQSPLVELFTEHNVYTAAFEQVLQGMFSCPPDTDPAAA